MLYLGAVGRFDGRSARAALIAASTLSHHIKHLMDAELIRQERQGTTLYCHANYPTMNALVGYLVDECCMDQKCKVDEAAA